MTTALELHDRWVGASSKARRLELLLTRCLTDEFGITSKTLRSDIENELDSHEGRAASTVTAGEGER